MKHKSLASMGMLFASILSVGACLWFVPAARANVINACSVGSATSGETMTCTFTDNHPTNLLTGTLTVGKVFTQTPGVLNVDLGLTNTIAGNNVPGIFIYTVTETILNSSGVAWTDFEISTPNADRKSVV